MAYTFDRINTLFRGRDANADVMGDKRGGSYGALKTSASGDVTDGSTGAATSTGGEAPVPQQMMASSGAAIKRNVGKAGIPGFTQRIQGQIEAGQTGLTNAANTYRQGYENRDYGISAADINAAVAGNAPDTFEKVKTRLATPKFGQVEAFKPEVDTEIEDAALLGSEQGTKRLLSRQGGNRYSAGEGAFDVTLLRRDPNFSRIADQLARQGKELSQKSTKLQSELPEQAQKVADTKYAAGTEAARQALGTQSEEVLAPSKAKEATINATRAKYADPNSPEAKAYLAAQTAAAKEAAGKDIAAYAPRASRFLDTAAQSIDPTKLYQAGKQISYQDIIDPESVGKFNRIQAMLGQGNLLAPGMGAGEDVMFNAPEYQKLVTQGAQGLRGVEDERLQARIAEINAAAQERANQYNQRIGGEEQARFAQIRDQLLQANPNLRASFADELRNLDPSRFINARSQVGTGDVYTQQEADEINAALSDLGSMSPRATVKNWQQGVNINEAGMNQLVADQLAKEEVLRRAAGNIQTGPNGTTITKGTSQEQELAKATGGSPIINVDIPGAIQRGSDWLAKNDPTKRWR